MVSLLQEEIITLPAFTAEFLLKTGRRLIQLGNNTQNGAQIIYIRCSQQRHRIRFTQCPSPKNRSRLL